MRATLTIQRVEAAAVALLAVVAVVVLYPAWWWVILAAFLVFDLSMLGYVRSPAAGAASYNLVHNYALPALAGSAALAVQSSLPAASTATGVLACAWAFHVGVDRALGYGLKMPDTFTHTHLGWIGKDRSHLGTTKASRTELRPRPASEPRKIDMAPHENRPAAAPPDGRKSEARVATGDGTKDYRRRIRIYLLVLAAVMGAFWLVNAPQCPQDFTQEQVDASRCIVGANIGLGLYLFLAIPVLVVVLGLLVVALYKQRNRSVAGELGPPDSEQPTSENPRRDDPDTTFEAEEAQSDSPRRRRRWPWIATDVVLVVVGMGTAVFQYGLPWWMEEGDHNHVYEGDAGSLRYQVHVPPEHDGTTQLPVIMAIHGCGMTGYGWNSMKSTTQFNSLADRDGFIVVYPTQRMFSNALNCWNSADPRNQQRHSGEPALLAGVAGQVVEEYNADSNHVHVAGASSGAGTAVILAATYPDIFATASSVAGGEYGLNQVDPDDPDSVPPHHTAYQAWSQMGDRARKVPLLVIQGEDDEVVTTIVATRLVEQWAAVSDLVDDGLLNDSLNLIEETTTVSAARGMHGHTRTTLTAAGKSVVVFYLVRDMGHAWPGSTGRGIFSDQIGPDASAIVWDFAQRHPKG